MGVTIKKIIVLLFFVLMNFLSWGSVSRVQASPEYDRVYQLESLGWLKPYDNVDGIFNDYVDEVYTKYFQQQSRFLIKKLTGLDDVLGKNKLPYYEEIKSPEVLKKIAQKFRVESLIRTKIAKEGETYRFTLEWVYAPKGDVLSQFEFRYVDPGKDKGLEESELPQAIQKALDQLIAKLPFLGQVTGVENDTITVNIGRNQGVQPKQILNIYTLQAVKRHPIENIIEEWRWQPTGRAQVEQVEDSLLFAKVMETEPNQTIAKYQKIKEIQDAPAEPETSKVSDSKKNDLPRLGWIAGNIGIGSYSRDVSAADGTNGKTGGGFLGSFEMEGMLWFNSRWLSELSLGEATIKDNPKDNVTGTASTTTYSGSATDFRIAAGYALFPAKTIFDAIGWVHAGYRYTSYSLPNNATDLTGGSSLGSIFIGMGGDLPITPEVALQLGFDLGLLRGASENFPDYGDVGSSTDLEFQVAGTYRYTERVFLRLLLKINSQSMDFPGGESVSQKMFSVAPSIMYYF